MKRSNIMTFFLITLLVFAAMVLVIARYYIENIYNELERLRVENVALKLKLAELVGGKDDQA